jgi:hypothetical protein
MLSICSCAESVRKLLSHIKQKSVAIPFDRAARRTSLIRKIAAELNCERTTIRVRLSYYANQSINQGTSRSSGTASPAARSSSR